MDLWDCHFIQFHVRSPELPWDIQWNFMELWSRPISKSPSSMRFHGIRRATFQMTPVFHGIPWNIPWNSMELWCRQMKYHLFPWNSIELWDCHFIQYHVTLFWGVAKSNILENSMQYHGNKRGLLQTTQKFRGWNSMEFWSRHIECNKRSMESHGNMVAPFQMSQVPWNIPWNSVELNLRQIKCHQVPWNSMELRERHFKWHQGSMEFRGIFLGISWNFVAVKSNVTKLHGTLRLSLKLTSGSLWLPLNIPWNCRVA